MMQEERQRSAMCSPLIVQSLRRGAPQPRRDIADGRRCQIDGDGGEPEELARRALRDAAGEPEHARTATSQTWIRWKLRCKRWLIAGVGEDEEVPAELHRHEGRRRRATRGRRTPPAAPPT